MKILNSVLVAGLLAFTNCAGANDHPTEAMDDEAAVETGDSSEATGKAMKGEETEGRQKKHTGKKGKSAKGKYKGKHKYKGKDKNKMKSKKEGKDSAGN